MVSVRQLLDSKPAIIWNISPNATVYAALEMLAEKDIGALPVVEDGKIVGIFSERDYARNVVLKGRSSRDMPVAELMVKRVHCVTCEQTIDDCMQLMTHKRVRHLPVVEDGKLLGIITIGDAVRQIISDQQNTIEQLESYIQGTM